MERQEVRGHTGPDMEQQGEGSWTSGRGGKGLDPEWWQEQGKWDWTWSGSGREWHRAGPEVVAGGRGTVLDLKWQGGNGAGPKARGEQGWTQSGRVSGGAGPDLEL